MSDSTFVTLAYVRQYRDMSALRWRGARLLKRVHKAGTIKGLTDGDWQVLIELEEKARHLKDAARLVQAVLENIWETDAQPDAPRYFCYSNGSSVFQALIVIDPQHRLWFRQGGRSSSNYAVIYRSRLPSLLLEADTFARQLDARLPRLIPKLVAIEKKGERACTKSTSLTA